MLTTATNRMPKWLMKWSMMSSAYRLVVVLNSSVLATAAGTATARTAVIRDNSNLSRTAAITTSSTEMSDVMPAMTSDTKNNTPSNAPAGASLMIVGNAMNARPMPPSWAAAPGSPPVDDAMNPSAAKTPIPRSEERRVGEEARNARE